MVSEQASYTQSYMLLAVLVIGMVVVLLFHRHQHVTTSGHDLHWVRHAPR